MSTAPAGLPPGLVGLERVDPHLDPGALEPESDLMVLNLGPQHPSTHGVLRIELLMDGEVCVKAVPHLGYLHRGVEKLCEKLTCVQLTPIFDKNDYVAPMSSELALNMAFEKLLGVEPPPRAQVMRTLVSELQRVASHLLWLGAFALDAGGALGGGATVFMYCFRERELVLDLFEELTGSRFHYNHHAVGGQRHDLPRGWDRSVHAAMDAIERRLDEIEAMVVDNAVFRARTVGVGRVDPLLAMELGASGPVLRASGVDFDLRRDAPFCAYDQVDLRVATERGGDCYARTLVRLRETRESIRLSRLLVDGIPEGPICALRPVKQPGAVKLPAGVAYAAVESPRGELGTWVMSEKGPRPYRLKIRPPSLHALSLLPYLCPGATLSDIVVILGSLDPILGEVDR